MKIYLLCIDPDNGDLDDVKTVAFYSRAYAESTIKELVDNGCESLLSIRELRVTDQWEIDYASYNLFIPEIGDDE